jgi:hypothetical protein
MIFGIRRICLRSGSNHHCTIPIYKKGDKTECTNYRDIKLLPITYTILSNILFSRLTPYAEEITGVCECGLRHNR